MSVLLTGRVRVKTMTDNDKFKGEYRILSACWAAWDYSSNAAYFLTWKEDEVSLPASYSVFMFWRQKFNK
jgi:hypothetical protein